MRLRFLSKNKIINKHISIDINENLTFEEFKKLTEKKALEYAMADITDWTDNAVSNQARIAKDEIISLLVAHCNANEIGIASGEDAQVTQAYDLKVVTKATAESEVPSEE